MKPIFAQVFLLFFLYKKNFSNEIWWNIGKCFIFINRSFNFFCIFCMHMNMSLCTHNLWRKFVINYSKWQKWMLLCNILWIFINFTLCFLRTKNSFHCFYQKISWIKTFIDVKVSLCLIGQYVEQKISNFQTECID